MLALRLLTGVAGLVPQQKMNRQVMAQKLFDFLDDAKEEWDGAVCAQFCPEITDVDGCPIENVVDAECPDQCMSENPDWKRDDMFNPDEHIDEIVPLSAGQLP